MSYSREAARLNFARNKNLLSCWLIRLTHVNRLLKCFCAYCSAEKEISGGNSHDDLYPPVYAGTHHLLLDDGGWGSPLDVFG
jgi:hypothetical protein